MEFNVDEVINEEKDKATEFMELSELFTELKSESAFTISEEKTKELLEKYNKLNLKVEATCSKYLKTEKRDGMDFTAESTTDKEYRYYLLYNSVATALRNHVDKMDCQTAHCGRCKPRFVLGEFTSPIVPYRNLPQALDGMTADCCSLV